MKNKMKITLAGFLFAGFFGFAQNIQGIATYETKMSFGNAKIKMDGLTPEMQKKMEERLKKMGENTFLLTFDKTTSFYKMEEQIDMMSNGGGGGMRMRASVGGGDVFKNVKEKSYASARDIMGKEFLVKDTLTNLKWKLESETKVIGGYTCYKATLERKPNNSFMKTARKFVKVDSTQTKKEGDANAPKTNILGQLKPLETEIVTAWYTPEIPISQGPGMYWGLPGLILEVAERNNVILCSKIVLNPAEKQKIEAPKKGKEVTQKEFDEIMEKKVEEMMEMRRGNGGDKGGFRIQIGG